LECLPGSSSVRERPPGSPFMLMIE
jgi:hypothetical protein